MTQLSNVHHFQPRHPLPEDKAIQCYFEAGHMLARADNTPVTLQIIKDALLNLVLNAPDHIARHASKRLDENFPTPPSEPFEGNAA